MLAVVLFYGSVGCDFALDVSWDPNGGGSPGRLYGLSGTKADRAGVRLKSGGANGYSGNHAMAARVRLLRAAGAGGRGRLGAAGVPHRTVERARQRVAGNGLRLAFLPARPTAPDPGPQ